MTEGEKCPQCKIGHMAVVDGMFLTCDECGFDVVIPKEKDE